MITNVDMHKYYFSRANVKIRRMMLLMGILLTGFVAWILYLMVEIERLERTVNYLKYAN